MDEIEREEQEIEQELEKRDQDIEEVDEAAGVAEGMTDRGLLDDVKEDRDMTPPNAADLPEDSIVA